MSQNDKLLYYMRKEGAITQAEAINEISCYRLSARVKDLKKAGYDIRDRWRESLNKFGEPVRFKEYWLVEQ